MRQPTPVSDSIKEARIERKEFDQALAKLLATPATSAAKISRKVKLRSRLRPLTRALLQE
jgi:hypothetical protein